MKHNRTFYRGLYVLLVLVLTVTALVLLNLIVGRLPSSVTRVNMNETGVISLAPQTRTWLQSVQKDAVIHWIVRPGQEDTYLGALLQRLCEETDRLTVETVDPVEQPGFAGQYTSRVVNQNALVVTCGEKSRFLDYTDLYHREDGSHAVFLGEQQLVSAIDYVTTDRRTVICVLAGHGEPLLPEGIRASMEAQNLEVRSLELAAAGAVPEDCSCLLVTGVETDLPRAEMQLVADYLLQGGSLCLFSTYLDEHTPNWNSMLAEFAMAPVPGIVVEGKSDSFVAGYPYYLLPKIAAHPVTEALALAGLRVLMPLTQALQVAEPLPEGVSCTPLLATTGAAYAKGAGFAMETTDKEPQDLQGPFFVGAAARREMAEGKTASVIWYPSAYILDDGIDATVSGGNHTLLAGSLQWLTRTEGPVTVDGKELGGGSLLLRGSQAGLLSALIVVVLPLAVLLCGAVVRKRRKAR